MGLPLNDEFLGLVDDDNTIISHGSHLEYGRVSDAVGELTSAILDCKFKGLLIPTTKASLREFWKAVSNLLEE